LYIPLVYCEKGKTISRELKRYSTRGCNLGMDFDKVENNWPQKKPAIL
jgi:hypothetical protein